MAPALSPSFTTDPMAFDPGPMDPAGLPDLLFGHHYHEAHAHVECPVHLSIIDISELLQQMEYGLWLQWICDLEAKGRNPVKLEKS